MNRIKSFNFDLMQKTAIFPGTFDPFTNGHLDIVNKGLRMFDNIIIAIGVNTSKRQLFPIEKRKEWIEHVFIDNDRVEVMTYSGLTTTFCTEVEAAFILRGLRTTTDYEYEKQIAFVNEQQSPELQSVFIMSQQENSIISSTIVRELIIYGGDYKDYLPEGIKVHEVNIE